MCLCWSEERKIVCALFDLNAWYILQLPTGPRYFFWLDIERKEISWDCNESFKKLLKIKKGGGSF